MGKKNENGRFLRDLQETVKGCGFNPVTILEFLYFNFTLLFANEKPSQRTQTIETENYSY